MVMRCRDYQDRTNQRSDQSYGALRLSRSALGGRSSSGWWLPGADGTVAALHRRREKPPQTLELVETSLIIDHGRVNPLRNPIKFIANYDLSAMLISIWLNNR